MMTRNQLGRYCEDLVAKMFGYKKVPASGSVWPHKEDLVRPGDHTRRRKLAQVKGTTDQKLLLEWDLLCKHAIAENATPKLYHVVVMPREAFVFSVTLVGHVDRGVGGDE